MAMSIYIQLKEVQYLFNFKEATTLNLQDANLFYNCALFMNGQILIVFIVIEKVLICQSCHSDI